MHALFPIGLPTPVKTVPDLHALSLPLSLSLSVSLSACRFLSLPSPFSWSSPFPLPLFSHPSPCFLFLPPPPHYSISSSILVSFSHFHILFNTIRLSSLSLSFFSLSFFLSSLSRSRHLVPLPSSPPSFFLSITTSTSPYHIPISHFYYYHFCFPFASIFFLFYSRLRVTHRLRCPSVACRRAHCRFRRIVRGDSRPPSEFRLSSLRQPSQLSP